MNYRVLSKIHLQKSKVSSKREENMELAFPNEQYSQQRGLQFDYRIKSTDSHEGIFKEYEQTVKLKFITGSNEKIIQAVDSDSNLVTFPQDCLQKSQGETKKGFSGFVRGSDEFKKKWLTSLCKSSGLQHQNFPVSLRGGCPVDDKSESLHSSILTKLHQYKERVLTDKKREEELRMFITTLTNRSDYECDIVEPNYDIRKHFLNCGNSKSPQVLFLAGPPGSGKSTFCKHLQNEILSDWSEPQNQEVDDDDNWFPIYIELSRLENSKSEAIPEILLKELSLTEEEILLLQTTDQNKTLLPRLLFIFDGYEKFKDFHHIFGAFNSKQNYTTNKVNEDDWKNAKCIITTREENLKRVQQRDFRLAPLNANSEDVSIIPGSFMQRWIEPFSVEQITCYLRKSHVLKNTLYTTPPSHSSTSWSLVEKFEKKIDEYGLREIARNPFMLKIIVDVLPDIVERDDLQKTDLKSTLSKMPESSKYPFLIDYFVNKIIKLVCREASQKEEEEKRQQQEQDLAKKIKLQLQSLALKLSNYSQGHTGPGMAMEDDSLLLKLYPLVEWDTKLSKATFICNMLQDFFVAKYMEEEILQSTTRGKDEGVAIPEEIRFNQRPLTNQSILFLRDSVRDQRLKPAHLMTFVMLSRQNEAHHQIVSEKSQGHVDYRSYSYSPFAIAAANAITILNSFGYDFSGLDLSSISIAGANLSYGIFEGTNFANSNLQGVEFTGAWLKDANFVRVNFKNIEFGEGPVLKLKKNERLSLAYSDNGNYFALEIGEYMDEKETMIFEKSWGQRAHYKEIKRVKCFSSCGYFVKSTFGRDSKQIITALGYNRERQAIGSVCDPKDLQNISVLTYDIHTNQCVERFDVLMGGRRLVHLGMHGKQVIAFLQYRIQKYDINSDSWIDYRIEIEKEVRGCDLSARGNMRNLIHKQHQRAEVVSCKFSSDGTQFVTRFWSSGAYVSDSIRGHVIKYLNDKKIYNCRYGIGGGTSFALDSKHILSLTGSELIIHDLAGTSSTHSDVKDYALNPDGKEIALLRKKGFVSFENLTMTPQPLGQTTTIRGTNNRGLNLKGSIVNSSFELSDQNILSFQEKGDYNLFDQNTIAKLFLVEPKIAENISEVVLSNDGLSPIHAKIIGNDLRWIHLQKLDLSQNNIGEDAGQAIGNNKSWLNLEVLALVRTEIGYETITAIVNNQVWKNLKTLELAFNKIGDTGAAAIGKSKLWSKLEILNLRGNEIEDEGAIVIGENCCWANLIKIDLSFNKIRDQKGFHVICSNGTWKHLKTLLLLENPVDLQEKNILKIIEEISSTQLIELHLPKAKFYRDLLQCFKYTEPKDVSEISGCNKGFTTMNAILIGSNTAWTNLRRLDFSKNAVGDLGGVKIGSNKFWINLEELDLSEAGLEVESGIAIAENTTWQKLKVLNLEGNKVRIKGARELSKNKTWINLQVLNLGSNQIGTEGARELSKNTTWENLQTLDLKDNYIRDEGARELSKNTTWRNLQTLDLQENKINYEGARELSKNTTWINLQTLNLGYNRISAEGARELNKNTTWINLQTLNLLNNKISAEGARELSKDRTWINLQTLNLGYSWIGDEGARELSKNTTWINLQTLNLERNNIGAEGARELSKKTTWINLQTLNLGYNQIGTEGARELSKNTTWINLQTLNLGYNQIGTEGARELSKNTTWINLQTLDLYLNNIGDEGARELSKNTTWINLQTLNLKDNDIGYEGARELSMNTTWINLQTLNLGYNDIGYEGARELSMNTTWINLQTLNLKDNDIGNKGARELSKNTTWINLQTLDLQGNIIGDEGARELSKNTTWINLQTLNLQKNNIGNEGARELSKNTTWINVQTLNLRSNWIGNEGARELSKNTTWINLQILNLQRNNIGAEGARELSKNTTWINLQTLNLLDNKIGAEGARDLSKNTTWINLQTLNLQGNIIGDEGARELSKNTTWINLQTLHLHSNKIGDEGVRELSKTKTWINLQTLNLRGNNISAEGARELSKNTTWINLQTLDLIYNNIGEKAAQELKHNPSWPNLQTLTI